MKTLFAVLLSLASASPARCARTFNGTSDSISMGNDTNLNFTVPMTVAAWVNYNGISPNAPIVSFGNATANRGWTFYAKSSSCGNGITLFLLNENGGCSGPATPTTGWAFIAVVVTASNFHYVVIPAGGALSESNEGGMPTTALTGANTGWIGYTYNSGSQYFSGSIASVMVWVGSALTDSELQAAAYHGPYAVNHALSGFWPLWGAASPEPDLSGNHFMGTLSGTTVANHCPCAPDILPIGRDE
jgi:hypothetical protein